ncbi:hypothetical protein [Yersinia enterocolitica]|uniref:hypothetical protein n=1 Tax=Yersinia enterocolitica TaxID=630 RepID=UPI0021E7D151|nr:hypothetical protein [Yersinia enterocolitica]MDA5532328.1 hypothetical protein [Yersinia enterocolitica]UYK07479.1 hypothetical protein N4218_06625 [Yersinia enterocolitica]
MIKTITAVPVERDNCGFWTHPDYFVPANGNEFGVEGEFDAWKALNRVVGKLEWMECEDNAEELQAAYDAGNCDLSMWQPNPPAGDGWFMASIHDTEDGPVCYWLRPIEFDPEALAAHFDNCYAEAFKTEHLVAERDAALNTCTLIAEALGITGAVAGDTIARVRQLVGEMAALWNENSVPEVKLGHQMQCWAIVRRTSTFNGKTTVRVAMLRYLNMPFEEGDDEVDWALQDDNGDYYNAVGWHSYHGHPEYSDYYREIEQEEEVLAWQPLVYPDLPQSFAASLRGEQNAK